MTLVPLESNKKNFSKILFKKALHYRNTNKPLKLTVAIPTYKRKTLYRAISSLANQSFKEFILIISDNYGSKGFSEKIVKPFKDSFSEIILIHQSRNLGDHGNMSFLLDYANSEYFMWLADDDEISSNYIKELYELLENNPSFSSACGKCKMIYKKNERYLKQKNISCKNLFKRISRFIINNEDDSWFYGLHKIKHLKQASFKGYIFGNRKVITDCSFVFLFDLILQSPVISSDKVEIIMHANTEKFYEQTKATSIFNKIIIILRRINVYIYYLQKTLIKSPKYLILVFFLSFIGFCNEVIKFLFRLNK